MAHLVDKDAEAESQAETPAEERDIKPNKDEEAEEEFELGQNEKQRFELEEEERDRAEGSEAFDPVGRRSLDGGGGGLRRSAPSGVGYSVVLSNTMLDDSTTIFFSLRSLCAQIAASKEEAMMRSFSASRS